MQQNSHIKFKKGTCGVDFCTTFICSHISFYLLTFTFFLSFLFYLFFLLSFALFRKYRGILELRFLSHKFNTLKMKKRLRPFSYRAGPHAISVSPLDMLSLPVSSSMDWEM
jgi:hypothetical protein